MIDECDKFLSFSNVLSIAATRLGLFHSHTLYRCEKVSVSFFSHTFQFQFKTGSTQCAFHSECCVELCKNCIRNSIEFDLVITIIFLVFNLINKMGQYAVSEHCTALHRHTHKHTHTFFLSFKCGSCVSTCSTFRYVRFIEQNVSCLYGRAVCLFRRCRFIHSFIRFEHVHNNNINRSQLQQ